MKEQGQVPGRTVSGGEFDPAVAKKRSDAAAARVAYWESQWRASAGGSEKEAWYEAIVMDLHDAAAGFAAALEALETSESARETLAELHESIASQLEAAGYVTPTPVAVEQLLEALEEAQREIEHLRTALNQQGHVVEFRQDGWAIEHPTECRKTSLLDCPLNSLCEEMGGPPTEGLGRYRAAISDDGNLLLDAILGESE